MNHPKHVFTALSVADESMNVDSDSDLGGMENPIEVSSSEGESSDGEIEELFDVGSGNNSVCLVSDELRKAGDPKELTSPGRPDQSADRPTDSSGSSATKPDNDKKDSCHSSSHQDSPRSQKRTSSTVTDNVDEPNEKSARLDEDVSSNPDDKEPSERESAAEDDDRVDD